MGEAAEGLSEMLAFNTELNTTSFAIAKVVASAILGVALIFVVYALATKKDNAKSYLIAWIIGVIFTIAFLIKF